MKFGTFEWALVAASTLLALLCLLLWLQLQQLERQRAELLRAGAEIQHSILLEEHRLWQNLERP